MCGIAGFFSADPTYDCQAIVARMLAAMRHRGPDQTGHARYGNGSIGMVRLSIVDTACHEIPYLDALGRHAIVYNGEIYNHENLRASLPEPYPFKTASDGETALACYLQRGIESFAEFNGMYSFAITDVDGKEALVVRDKVGEKPMYYHQGPDFFAFASEMKALLEVVEARFNTEALSYKAYEFTVGRETLFRDIYVLEPGEYIRVRSGRGTVHSYWKIWDNLLDIKDNESKLLHDLTELVEDAIMLRTKNCAHKYAAFVSGGVDSALVACVAKPDFIYTAHYDFEDFDELDYAKLVARKIGRELQILRPSKDDFIATRERLAYHLDTPCTWTSFSLWMLVERLAKDGMRVVMTGDGADELFGGYYRYYLLHHDEQIHNLEAMKKYSYLINKYYGSPVDRYARLVNRCENTFDEEVQEYLHATIGFYFDKMEQDIVHLMGLHDFYTTMQVLLHMGDRVNMAFGVENRSPLLDYRLVQFAFSMPSKYKIRDGVTKWVLKQVASKFIPKEIVERIDKRGFSAPVNRWFKWESQGKYNRSVYRTLVFEDWQKVMKVDSGLRPNLPRLEREMMPVASCQA